MKAKLATILVIPAIASFLGAIIFLPTGPTALAAAPGGRSASSPQAPSSAQAAPAPVRQSLAGAWKLNAKQSDDPTKKVVTDVNGPLADAGTGAVPAKGLLSSQNTGGMGGVGSMGGPGMGGGIGSMPQAAPSHQWETDKDRQKRMESLMPAATLTVEQKDNEFDFLDDRGRKQIFYIDGRKLPKSKDEKVQMFAARWDAGHLSYEEKLAPHGKITRTFELDSDGPQMYETTEIDNGSLSIPIDIKYVYDPAPAPAARP